MKYISVFVFVILLPVVSHSQYWAPESAIWHYDQDDFAPPFDKKYVRYISLGDTMFDGKNLIQLEESVITSNSVNTASIFMEFENNRVYYYDTIDRASRLLYDFNATQGESIEVYCRAHENYETIWIDSVTTMDINGDVLKVQYFSQDPDQCFMKSPVIERIGFTGFMFPQFGGADPPFGGPLRCYEDPFLGLYNRTGMPCDYISTDIEEPDSSQSLKLTPNPATSTLYLQSGIHWEMIQVFDLSGREMRRLSYKRNVDIRFLPDGVYLLVAQDKMGRKVRRKFIKASSSK